ncbi:MAG: 50S ribosomal protein L22 [Planctomycetota bacterium]|nr:50S ribosomal protein L22 [Planctomycetota bacterium]
MGYRASHRFARISPRKAGLVMEMIRGMPLEEALKVLDFSPKRAAKLVAKVVRSAMANADEQEADLEALYVADARADMGPALKRVWPRSRGSADMLRRPTCHLIVELEQTKDSKEAEG